MCVCVCVCVCECVSVCSWECSKDGWDEERSGEGGRVLPAGSSFLRGCELL